MPPLAAAAARPHASTAVSGATGVTVAVFVPHKAVKKMMRFNLDATFGDVRKAVCQALYRSTVFTPAEEPGIVVLYGLPASAAQHLFL
jgi:hypothetical protein